MGGVSELSKFLETFPPDIKEAAWSEVNGSLGYIDSTEGAVAVARAILAERQRCAGIAELFVGYAESQAGSAHPMEAKRLAESAASWIHDAIMSGEK